jgi:hypothetical protein
VARNAGATCASESRKGYGYACLKGMEYIASLDVKPDIVFLDGDYSDYPEELTKIIAPIVNDNIDFVRESRSTARKEFNDKQVFAATTRKLFCRATFTDLGPLEPYMTSYLR